MQSLKFMVETQGMTIASVIHQPRKFIFDLFDSLLLLGVGGTMVYHGPTSQAQPYFESLNFVLPNGESVADWLIDISTGRSEADEQTGLGSIIDEASDSDLLAPLNEASLVGTTGIMAGQTMKAEEEAKQRRSQLYDRWRDYFENMDEQQKCTTYGIPAKSDLPDPIQKSPFISQLIAQTGRGFLVSYRNRFSKFIDTGVLVGAVVVISALDGVSQVSQDWGTIVDFDEATRPNFQTVEESAEELFQYAAKTNQVLYPLKVGIIVAVLTGLQATRITTSKQTEFFREASTNNMNAYYVAINIVSTVEHSIQIILASFVAFWLRNPWQSWIAYYTHFLLLTWISVSWALFLPQAVPPDNVIVVIGFFFAFCGLLLGGAFPPLTYKSKFFSFLLHLLSPFVSTQRYTKKEGRKPFWLVGFHQRGTSLNLWR